MSKAIFTTKVEPSYDDLPEFRYHFPRTYLRQATAAVGDWIVYYEPRRGSEKLSSRGGRQAYFATARVDRIDADPGRKDHFYAHVTDYLEFDRPVPFREGGAFRESSLRKGDGSTNKGAFGRAVRAVSEREYQDIVAAGFATLLAPPPREGEVLTVRDRWGWTGEGSDADRPREPAVGTRWFRDRAFTAHVRDAYANRCAFTGLRILNGGGRPEVQAAHIQPVAERGPDAVRNGLALSSTVHWMFDRGLLSLDDDGRFLMAAGHVPSEVQRLLRPEGRALLPSSEELRPHPVFLRYHREQVFKGAVYRP